MTFTESNIIEANLRASENFTAPPYSERSMRFREVGGLVTVRQTHRSTVLSMAGGC